MSEKTLSTADVCELLKVERGTLLYHVHLLRGLLMVAKENGRYEFTEAQVAILRHHLRDARRGAQSAPDDSDDTVRFQERLRQVKGVRRELQTLLKDMGPLLQGLSKVPTSSTIISTLPLPDYQLIKPVRVLLYPFRCNFRASFPEARLLVEERTREDAVLALRAAFLRAYLDLPPSPPLDDPQAADQWQVLHALIAPVPR